MSTLKASTHFQETRSLLKKCAFYEIQQTILEKTDLVPLGLLVAKMGGRRLHLMKKSGNCVPLKVQYIGNAGETIDTHLKIRHECFYEYDEEDEDDEFGFGPQSMLLCDTGVGDMYTEDRRRPKWQGRDISMDYLDGSIASLFDPSLKPDAPFTPLLHVLDDLVKTQDLYTFGFLVMDKTPYLDTGVKRVWSICHKVRNKLCLHALHVVGEPGPIPLVVRNETDLLNTDARTPALFQSELEMRVLPLDFFGPPIRRLPPALKIALNLSTTVPQDEACCICLGIVEPVCYVMTNCQHPFCNCILHHISTNGVKCPMCRQSVALLTYNQAAAYAVAKEFPGISVTEVSD